MGIESKKLKIDCYFNNLYLDEKNISIDIRIIIE